MLLFKSKREKILAREFKGADAAMRDMDPLLRFGIVCRMRDYVTAGKGLQHFLSLNEDEQLDYVVEMNDEYRVIRLRGNRSEIIPIGIYLILLESISMGYSYTEKQCRQFMERGMLNA